MKKLNLLIIMALCVVISGVYAGWTFATGAVAKQTSDLSITVDTAEEISKGTVGIQNTLALKIGPASVSDMTPALTGTGNIVITFTKDAKAAEGTEVDLEYKITKTGDDNNYFNVDSTAKSLKAPLQDKGKDEITAEQLIALLNFNCAAPKNKTEADTLITALKKVSFTITVTEKAPAQS